MGAHQSFVLASYEDVLAAKTSNGALFVNTLDSRQQDCLILDTTTARDEEQVLNGLIESGATQNQIVVYGRNCTDKSPYRKAEQLRSHGFGTVAVYPGGMLEWCLLQDAYGEKAFPTTMKCDDLMCFSPSKQAH